MALSNTTEFCVRPGTDSASIPQMLAPHFQLGQDVEEAALGYFLRRTPSAILIARNWRVRGGELDLVFEESGSRGRELVFVEVRARSGGGLAKGYETLGPLKRKRLKHAIRTFLARYPTRGAQTRSLSMRVDLLSWDSGKWTHLKNVWI